MIRKIASLVSLALLCLIVAGAAAPALLHAEDPEPCTSFFTPFREPGRDAYRTFRARVIGFYGDYRRTHVAGHRHGGVDLKGNPGEPVYAAGIGRVAYRYWPFPNETVVVRHRLPVGETFYTVYTHIVDIRVNPGDPVTPDTVIGRLFGKEEQTRAKFSTPHLHFEIRKDMEDIGRASFTSMTKKELDRYAADPLLFMKSRMK